MCGFDFELVTVCLCCNSTYSIWKRFVVNPKHPTDKMKIITERFHMPRTVLSEGENWKSCEHLIINDLNSWLQQEQLCNKSSFPFKWPYCHNKSHLFNRVYFYKSVTGRKSWVFKPCDGTWNRPDSNKQTGLAWLTVKAQATEMTGMLTVTVAQVWSWGGQALRKDDLMASRPQNICKYEWSELTVIDSMDSC